MCNTTTVEMLLSTGKIIIVKMFQIKHLRVYLFESDRLRSIGILCIGWVSIPNRWVGGPREGGWLGGDCHWICKPWVSYRRR